MNKTIRLLVGLSLGALTLTVVSVLAASSIVAKRGSEASRASSNIAPAAGGSGGAGETAGVVLTAAEVATHNNATNCWMIIGGNVYNLTTFLPLHPGGQTTMTPYCGKEATSAFNTKDKQPASKHTQTATGLLATYFVGSLGQTITTLTNPLSKDAGTNGNTAKTPVPAGLQQLANALAGTTPKAVGPALTTATVATHNTPGNCWLIIFGGVFDVTPYLAAHPGGIGVIIPYCGHDATDAFATKGKNPGISHSASAQQILSKYFIGNIGNAAGFQGTGSVTVTPTPTLLPGQTAAPTPTPLPQVAGGYSSATVASHNTASNCWIIISGTVYNVTSYLVLHPGGVSAITPYCGQEATNAFSTKGGGGSHSAYAYTLLSSYAVGPLQTGATATPTPTLVPGQTAAPTPTPTRVPLPTPTPTPLPQSGSGYTTADVASHNTSANCWIIISSKAYNVTNYLTSHPGGVSAITPYCGKEATSAFQTKGGRGSNHSTSAYNLLNSYFIGNIVAATGPTPTPIPGQTATPTPTPTTAVSGGSCTRGVLPSSVSSKYPGATIRSQSIEDNCSQELEINTSSGQCRHIKVNSSGSITSDQSC